MENDIFISYSRKDTAIIDQFVNRLTEAGYHVWIDREGIYSGDQFKAKIVRAIKDSTIVLFFSSVNSNASEWTVKEIGYALKKGKTIIPVKLDDTEYEDSIDFDLVNIDFIQYNQTQSYSAIERLISSIVAHCGKRPTPISSDTSSKTIKLNKSHDTKSKQSQTVPSSRKNTKSKCTSGSKTIGTIDTDNRTKFDVVLKAVGPQKLQVIKKVKEILNIGLVYAKDLVDKAEYTPTTIMESVGKSHAVTIMKTFESIGATIELKPTGKAVSKNTKNDDRTMFDVVLKAVGPQKLQVIKKVKDILNMGLADAKDLVDKADYTPVTIMESVGKSHAVTIMKTFKSIGAMIELKPTGKAVSKNTKNDDRTKFDVALKAVGQQKLQVIKKVQEILNIGLVYAKHLVDKAEYTPTTIMESVGKSDAVTIMKTFESIGATIELKPTGKAVSKNTKNDD